jgi:hypothetical protein
VDLPPDLSPTSLRREGLRLVLVFVSAHIAFIVGAAIVFRLDDTSLSWVDFLWVLPGIGLGLWAFSLWESWREERFSYHGQRSMFVVVFMPAIVVGYLLQEALR